MNHLKQLLIIPILLITLPQTQAADFVLTVKNIGNGSVISDPSGINCGESCTKQYAENTTVKLTAVAKAGSQFTGWTENCTGSSNPTYVILTENKSCTANFEALPPQKYDLTVAKTAHGKVTSVPAGIDCGTDCTEQYDEGTAVSLIAEADADSTFSRWGGDCESSTVPSISVTVDAAKTCTANFKRLPIELTVTKTGKGDGTVVSSNMAGINCGTECTTSYDSGTTVTLRAQPDTASEFTGWVGDCTGTEQTTSLTIADKALTCSADFKPLPHALSLTKNGNGTVISDPSGINCGSRCIGSFEEGLEVKLTAEPDADYEFTDWTGDCTGEAASSSVIVDADKTCTANFKRLPLTLTVAKSGNGTITSDLDGIDCGSTCTATYELGTAIKLTVTPDTDSEFIAWYGDCAGSSASTTVDLFSSQHCIAHFADTPAEGQSNLSVIAIDDGQGKVKSEPDGIDCDAACTAAYAQDLTVKLTATPEPNSTFEGWDVDCGGTEASTTITLNQTSNLCLAHFQLIPSTHDLTITKSGNGFGTIKSDLTGIDCGSDCVAPFTQDSTVTLTVTPQPGSIFKGWSHHCSGMERSTTVTLNEAKTCTASFELLPTYNMTLKLIGEGEGTVTSNIEGVSCGAECVQYYQGAEITLTAVPDSYSKFLSWGVDCTGTGNPITITLNTTKNCTAEFEKLPTYELTVTKIGSGQGVLTREPEGLNCGSNCERYPQGTIVTLTATPEIGSTLTTWSGHCTGNESPLAITIGATAQVCTATFDKLPVYTLTVQNAGNGTVISEPEGIQCGELCSTSYYGGTAVTLTATPSAGAKFTAWTGCENTPTDDPTKITVAMVAAQNCIANFEALPPSPLTVTKIGTGTGTVTAPAGLSVGIDCGETCTENYAANTEITLTATPTDVDSSFSGWSGDCKGTEPSTTLTLDVAKTCTASFDRLAPPGQHNLAITPHKDGIITSDPAGINCGAACTVPYPENSMVTLTATPNEGFVFTSWDGDCNSTSNITPILMNAGKICMANFYPLPPAGQHYLTVIQTGPGRVTSDVGGIDCGVDCTAAYPQGVSVTLTATPEAFSRFIGWEGNCSGEIETVTVNITEAQICTAQFEALPSSVQFSISKYQVNEIEGKVWLSVTRAASRKGAISVDYTTADASAIAGSDYTAMTGTLSWADNEMAPKIIEIPILLDAEKESNEILTVTLTQTAGPVQLGANNTAIVTIVDTPTGGAGGLQFSAAHYAVDENSSMATISIERIGGKNGAVSVTYATQDDTAQAGLDYTTTEGKLNWYNGDSETKTFRIPIEQDIIEESDENLILTLSNPTGKAFLSANRTASLKIIDSMGTPDTLSSPGILQFTAPNYQVAEDSGSATLTVSRTHGSHGEVAVNYKTQDRTAKADQDYVAAEGVLTWADSDVDNKTITVSIQPDSTKESQETLTVSLSNPSETASLGAVPTAILTILDSLGTPTTPKPREPGILQFAADNYQVDETGGSLTITVTRTNGTDGLVEVTYITEEDTASGRDYIAAQDTLRWLHGESDDKIFKISLYDDGLIEGDESFLLKLINPTGEAKLGSNPEAIVTITDNDATTLQLSSSTYIADEDSKSLTITVSREGGRIGQVGVEYETLIECQPPTELCATAGQDYKAVKGLLIWVTGQTGDRTFSIPLIDDREVEGNEIVQLKLSNLTGNANFGEPIEATITLVDNDPGECKTGDVIDCYWENKGNTLEDIRITPFGTLVGGQIGGQIENEGIVQDVTFLANTRLNGGLNNGIVRGNLIGDPNAPAILRYVEIAADSTLSHLIIGQGSVVNEGVVLKENVLFEANGLIPYKADLNRLLGHFTTLLDQDAIQLTEDVLLNSSRNGILDAINGLHDFTSLKVALQQNPDNGSLMLDFDTLHFRLLPIQVRQIWGKQTNLKEPFKPLGLSVEPTGQVTFVTHTGREITTQPVVQEPESLRASLNQFGITDLSMATNGNLKIATPDGRYYSARPDLSSQDIASDTPLGLGGTDSNWLSNQIQVFLVFKPNDSSPLESPSGFESRRDSSAIESTAPSLRQQFLYAAAAEPSALYALSAESDSQTVLYYDGRVYAYTGKGASKKAYKGVLDYLVTPGTPTGLSQAQLIEIEDINGDDITDYRLIYPNGDTQVMYQCAACFE